MKKIIVPTDFSKTADNALEYALLFASHHGIEVIIHHAFETSYSHPSIPVKSYPMANDEVRTRLKELQLSIQSDPRFSSLLLQTHAMLGGFVDTLSELVKKTHADMVVMGTKGAGPVKGTLLGSNAVDVINHLSLPTLIIPKEAKFKPIDKIMFATDHHMMKKPDALIPLKEVAKMFHAEVTLVNVRDRHQKTTLVELHEHDRESTWLGEDIPHSSEAVLDDDVLHGLQTYIENHQELSMIAMVARQHNIVERMWNGGNTRRMAFYSTIPLLALHE
ncbi:MAG: universal stress protein [Flavobacteriales bacterium]|nr:universal stress protein [Flavobacteriales bacterium]